MNQLSFETEIIKQKRENEFNKPAKQQIQTADVVMFIGTVGRTEDDLPIRIPKNTLAFVNGAKSGVYDTHINTRSQSAWVCSLDLKPMKVTEF